MSLESTSPEARMGNDIARQFAHLPPDRAAEAVARHLDRGDYGRLGGRGIDGQR